jgi:hypothetical protein
VPQPRTNTIRQSYKTPEAFRRSLNDRLRARAAASDWTLPQLQRQFAYDRLLARLYLSDDGWIVKGATALLAREVSTRSTRDIDIYRPEPSEEAETAFRRAVHRDADDWFNFELGASQALGEGGGVAIPVTAVIGATVWAEFHVDLVGSDLRMTGTPEAVAPLASLGIPGFQERGYRAYPLVDHVADKVAAIFERHGDGLYASTRYKDLVDLVAIALTSSVAADSQREALRSEFRRRNLPWPGRFAIPSEGDWLRGYQRAAREAGKSIPKSLDEAMTVASRFLDPLLAGTAAGSWDGKAQAWT